MEILLAALVLDITSDNVLVWFRMLKCFMSEVFALHLQSVTPRFDMSAEVCHSMTEDQAKPPCPHGRCWEKMLI